MGLVNYGQQLIWERATSIYKTNQKRGLVPLNYINQSMALGGGTVPWWPTVSLQGGRVTRKRFKASLSLGAIRPGHLMHFMAEIVIMITWRRRNRIVSEGVTPRPKDNENATGGERCGNRGPPNCDAGPNSSREVLQPVHLGKSWTTFLCVITSSALQGMWRGSQLGSWTLYYPWWQGEGWRY